MFILIYSTWSMAEEEWVLDTQKVSQSISCFAIFSKDEINQIYSFFELLIIKYHK